MYNLYIQHELYIYITIWIKPGVWGFEFPILNKMSAWQFLTSYTCFGNIHH